MKDASSSKAEDWYEVARNHFQGWSPSNGDSSPGAPHIQSSGRSFHLIVPPACECDQEPTLPRSLHTRTPDAIVNQLSRASIGRCLSLIQKSSPWSKQNNTEAEDAKQTTEAMQRRGSMLVDSIDFQCRVKMLSAVAFADDDRGLLRLTATPEQTEARKDIQHSAGDFHATHLRLPQARRMAVARAGQGAAFVAPCPGWTMPPNGFDSLVPPRIHGRCVDCNAGGSRFHRRISNRKVRHRLGKHIHSR